MDPIPTSVIAAIACSAAAGKNPWLPIGLLLLLGAPDAVPSLLMEPSLHDAIHALGPAEVLYGLGGVFVVLAILDSLADKLPFVERWLVPVSTAWRPFAGIAVATVIGYATAQQQGAHDAATSVTRADFGLTLGLVATCALAGATFGWLATIGKTGARLLLSLVPLPGLRLAHSFLDDFFALSATAAGLVFAASPLIAVVAALYLLAGLFVGPLLSRLAGIHVRIGWLLLRKALRSTDPSRTVRAPTPPAWLVRALEAAALDPARATFLQAYAYAAPSVGACRAGWVVVAPDALWFAARTLTGPRFLRIEESDLVRIGLAQTTTSRRLQVVMRGELGLREIVLTLFPAEEAEIVPLLEHGSIRAGFERVRPDSESARAALFGHPLRGRDAQFPAAAEAGSLSVQASVTLAAAVGVGFLTGGIFVPIGAGYLVSPFKLRALVGLGISAWLALCVLGSGFFAWPAAVTYASLLNAIALRDLARQQLKARVDGFVDVNAILPVVCERVWVPRKGLLRDADRHQDADRLPQTDGSWRAVLRTA